MYKSQIEQTHNFTRFEQVRSTIASKINVTPKGGRLSEKPGAYPSGGSFGACAPPPPLSLMPNEKIYGN